MSYCEKHGVPILDGRCALCLLCDRVKIHTFQQAKEICLANGAGDASDEIASEIYAIEHPDFRA